jgi:hypothetical protein
MVAVAQIRFVSGHAFMRAIASPNKTHGFAGPWETPALSGTGKHDVYNLQRKLGFTLALGWRSGSPLR